MNKIPLIIVAGPTASGKTALSIQLAKVLNGEVISADSMQVYRGMDIGTAKVTAEEMDGVPHHLIDIVDPADPWNVMEFCRRAGECIQDIAGRGCQPIIAGGTGFYIHALAYGAEFEEENDDTIRAALEKQSPKDLYRQLQEVDPVSAEIIHPNNVKRVVRALEYYQQTGQPISSHNAVLKEKPSPYDLTYLVLDWDRAVLYERIERRVDIMLEQGLEREVAGLLQKGVQRDWVSMQGLGYKETAAWLEGDITREEGIYLLKRDTRRFAKRQLTWFRREPEAIFLPVQPQKTLLERALEMIGR